ncbi:MAG: hypothetical protein GW762_05975 [Candidatus Pacebacteria bacterium]|nr:hypothetical protein [Candidatus Paceibacterota bacterium]PIR64092.1 MAG: hypothetical protein COU64_00890 [Candidatus Pacebacteria bacterium CG10_big_fil_rev_8_21_14_0_10_40_26]PIZ78444.1 MAG: hypothetical protein COY01_04270 [Candidatus Pacebacteria bacterium CG_4_10_14_0_2_um_filter_40_20]PJA69294.1 MAG: hypothetical protein CO156_00155 [Candidatus Pacebacteria bacterium CG_4_9_14_3_um_filter_40_12]PJC41977.1 MAG: hypothetical protein CO041_01710 [Candidatus Pacebacteria bacterium CG_4_9_
MTQLRLLQPVVCFLLLCLTFFVPTPAEAITSIPAGIHILSINEVAKAGELTEVAESDTWRYVTVPFTLADISKKEEWQLFFDTAKEQHLIPLVRLTTSFSDTSWQVPTKKNIVEMITVLSALDWPTDQRHIIVFNEVNHAKEWGGRVNPEEYVDLFTFTAQWAHTEDKNYIVLPAALDLAAPNGSATMEAFTYLEKMYELDSNVFAHADAWNSHSYPNPGFSSSPERIGKNSLRGFQVELAWLKEKTDKDYLVYITETGWDVSGRLSRWMPSYYEYAVQHIWSDPSVVAVTPFLLQGAPGPFEGFSFIDEGGKPTSQYISYKNALKKQYSDIDLLSAKIDIIE